MLKKTLKSAPVMLFCYLPVTTADDLDLIPDSILRENVLQESPLQADESSQFGDWDFFLRGQVQRDKTTSGDDQPRLYVSGNLYGDNSVGAGRGIVDLNFRTLYSDDESYSVKDDSSLNVKELYYSHSFDQRSFIDIGRINHKSGVAYGFNPTDYFKENVTVDTSDSDARSRRNNRLGTLGLRFEKALDESGFIVLVSPKLTPDSGEFLSDKNVSGLNLQKSNSRNRMLFSFSNSSSNGWFNRFSYLYTDEEDSLGFSTSMVVTDKLLGYAEISGAKTRTLFSRYLRDGVEQGEISDAFASQFAEEPVEYRFLSTLGLSYTSEKDVVSTLEYIHSDLGPSSQESSKWYSLLQSSPEQSAELWSIRGHYSGKEHPFARDLLWLRTVWNEPFDRFDFGLLGTYILDDSSYLIQGSLNYDASDSVDLEIKATAFNGSENSFYGSLPTEYQYLLQLSWYF